jgi:hypothetical protein
MENPRPEKVQKVAEVVELLNGSDAVLLTEYRGMQVKHLSELRRTLRPVGGEYKIYKNTLVWKAALAAGKDTPELEALLKGPTAIAFVKGDAVEAAKAACSATKFCRRKMPQRLPTCHHAFRFSPNLQDCSKHHCRRWPASLKPQHATLLTQSTHSSTKTAANKPQLHNHRLRGHPGNPENTIIRLCGWNSTKETNKWQMSKKSSTASPA